MEQPRVEVGPMSEPVGLFDLVGGGPLAIERTGEAQSMQVAIRAGVASLAFSSIYGVAAGCTDLSLALSNPIKLPVVVVLAVGCALPPGLLVWKVVGRGRLSDLLVSLATGVFTATLVLACASPLLALYYLTTETAGAPLAFGVTFVALSVGVGNAVRSALRRSETGARAAVLLPIGTMLGVLLMALVQLVFLASPILPEDTWFDHGVDGWLERP